MEQYYEVLKVLSDESRFKIITILLKNDLCVGGLARRLDISKPAVSQHLQVLRKAGLVTGEKRGYYTHYIVNRALLTQAGERLIEIASKQPDGVCSREQNGECSWQCQCSRK